METGKFAECVRSALIAELKQLHNEILDAAKALTDAQLWKRPLTESNSVGHLMLHLTGNLNHFVGAQLGNTGYVRNREREFTDVAPPPRAAVERGLGEAVAIFERVVSGLTEQQLTATHPTEKFGTVVSTLVHLVAHFALHRGQITYIWRLVISPTFPS
jgi:uncharacterized damage-inducible protein DinB